MPIAAPSARIRKLIRREIDPHYDEIDRGFGIGELCTPASSMRDRELSRAIDDLICDAPSAEAVSSLGRKFNPTSGV